MPQSHSFKLNVQQAQLTLQELQVEIDKISKAAENDPYMSAYIRVAADRLVGHFNKTKELTENILKELNRK